MGPLAILVFLAALLGLGGLFYNHPGMSFLVVSGCSAAIVFAFGRFMNRRPLEVVELHKEGKVVVKIPRHTIYSLPMEYWGPLLFAFIACMCVYQDWPKHLKGSSTPQVLSVSELVSKGPGNNINLSLTDYQIGSKILELRKEDDEGGTAYLPIFPAGQADRVAAPMVVATKRFDDAEEFKKLGHLSPLAGIVMNGIRDASVAQQSMAKQYNRSDAESILVLDLDEKMPSDCDVILSPLCALGGLLGVYWLWKKDATRWSTPPR
jgi:hypothetical protein